MASLFPPWFYACRRRRSSIRGKRSRPYRTKRKKHYAALRESKNRKRNSLYASYVSYIVSSKLSYAWDYDFDPLTAARHSLRVFYIHEISESNRTPRGREERKVSRISRSLNRFLVNFVSFEHQHAYDPLIKFLCGQKVGESSYGEKCRVKSNVSYATWNTRVGNGRETETFSRIKSTFETSLCLQLFYRLQLGKITFRVPSFLSISLYESSFANIPM